MGRDTALLDFMRPKRKKCEGMCDRLRRVHAEADSVVAREKDHRV
jgi:hypothetical protein